MLKTRYRHIPEYASIFSLRALGPNQRRGEAGAEGESMDSLVLLY